MVVQLKNHLLNLQQETNGINMPIVGNMKFPYDDEGVKAANEYARESGLPMRQTYRKGGEVMKYNKGGKAMNKAGASRRTYSQEKPLYK